MWEVIKVVWGMFSRMFALLNKNIKEGTSSLHCIKNLYKITHVLYYVQIIIDWVYVQGTPLLKVLIIGWFLCTMLFILRKHFTLHPLSTSLIFQSLCACDGIKLFINSIPFLFQHRWPGRSLRAHTNMHSAIEG